MKKPPKMTNDAALTFSLAGVLLTLAAGIGGGATAVLMAAGAHGLLHHLGWFL